MVISISADERVGIALELEPILEALGHTTLGYGVFGRQGPRLDWAGASRAVAEDVASGRAELGIVCCWTGTGASIAANKVAGVRAALCGDGETASGARLWNDANVLALSLRQTSTVMLREILDAWFKAQPSEDPDDLRPLNRLKADDR